MRQRNGATADRWDNTTRIINAKTINTNPYYRVLRDTFNRPADKALAAVRWYEEFRKRMESKENER